MSRTSEWMGLCAYQEVRTRLCRSSDPQSPRSFQDPADGVGGAPKVLTQPKERTPGLCVKAQALHSQQRLQAHRHPTGSALASSVRLGYQVLQPLAETACQKEVRLPETGTLTGRVDSRDRGQRNRKNSRYTDTKGVGSHGARARLHAGCSAETGLVPSESGSGHRSRSQAVSQKLTEFKVFAMTSMPQTVKNLPPMQETWVPSLEKERFPGEGKIPWRRE